MAQRGDAEGGGEAGERVAEGLVDGAVSTSRPDRVQVNDRPLVVGALETHLEMLVVVQVDVALGVD